MLSRVRRAARVDDNQCEIVKALRAAGATVQSIAAIGKGAPDILVGYRGRNLLMEIKDGSKPKSRQSLTALEADWHTVWRGQVCIVNSSDQAVKLTLGLDP